MSREEIIELISRRRRQILVHSVIYYKLDENLISDNTWAEWAKELRQLQSDYPDLAKECPYADDFKSFDASTGYNLPLSDRWAIGKAHQLLRLRDNGIEERIKKHG